MSKKEKEKYIVKIEHKNKEILFYQEYKDYNKKNSWYV